jgi:hypothetical protein
MSLVRVPSMYSHFCDTECDINFSPKKKQAKALSLSTLLKQTS